MSVARIKPVAKKFTQAVTGAGALKVLTTETTGGICVSTDGDLVAVAAEDADASASTLVLKAGVHYPYIISKITESGSTPGMIVTGWYY